MVDPADVCPLLDGCPHTNGKSTSADADADGCPDPGGVPFAADCQSDERRLANIAAEIQQRPKLTTLRITSGVAGCAETLRAGLERAGIQRERLETLTHPKQASTHCEKWGYFSIAAWDGGRCTSPAPQLSHREPDAQLGSQ
jgi:hypothetical protein